MLGLGVRERRPTCYTNLREFCEPWLLSSPFLCCRLAVTVLCPNDRDITVLAVPPLAHTKPPDRYSPSFRRRRYSSLIHDQKYSTLFSYHHLNLPVTWPGSHAVEESIKRCVASMHGMHWKGVYATHANKPRDQHLRNPTGRAC